MRLECHLRSILSCASLLTRFLSLLFRLLLDVESLFDQHLLTVIYIFSSSYPSR